MSNEDLGGDPPCWAHLVEGELAGQGGAVHLNGGEAVDEHVNGEVGVL